jgi:hypothetical protein
MIKNLHFGEAARVSVRRSPRERIRMDGSRLVSTDFSKADPAEGARDVIDRELARQAQRNALQEKMGPLTHDDVLAAIRDADDHLVLEMVATGASLEEFSQAIAWVSDDEAARAAETSPPSGRVEQLVELLRGADDARAGSAMDER